MRKWLRYKVISSEGTAQPKTSTIQVYRQPKATSEERIVFEKAPLRLVSTNINDPGERHIIAKIEADINLRGDGKPKAAVEISEFVLREFLTQARAKGKVEGFTLSMGIKEA